MERLGGSSRQGFCFLKKGGQDKREMINSFSNYRKKKCAYLSQNDGSTNNFILHIQVVVVLFTCTNQEKEEELQATILFRQIIQELH